jgi:hypothetical protein
LNSKNLLEKKSLKKLWQTLGFIKNF